LFEGIYLLLRDGTKSLEAVKSSLGEGKDFLWRHVEELPIDLPLYLLTPMNTQNLREIAYKSTCSQDVSKNGAFCLGMISKFSSTINDRGNHMYKRLFWECGLIGQVIYVEAEALGMRGTSDSIVHNSHSSISDWTWMLS
jgi:hypothetical protein